MTARANMRPHDWFIAGRLVAWVNREDAGLISRHTLAGCLDALRELVGLDCDNETLMRVLAYLGYAPTHHGFKCWVVVFLLARPLHQLRLRQTPRS